MFGLERGLGKDREVEITFVSRVSPRDRAEDPSRRHRQALEGLSNQSVPVSVDMPSWTVDVRGDARNGVYARQ